MSLMVQLVGKAKRLLGASWANPLRSARFGAGGGDYHSPTSLTATKTTAESVTLSGVVPTINSAADFRAVRAYDASGRLTGEWYPSEAYGFIWDATNSILTVSGADWSSAHSLDVEIHAEHRAYSSIEDSYQSWVTNPEHVWIQTDTLVDATNVTDGTVYYYVDFDTYRYAIFQLSLDCTAGTVTATMEATAQDDGTAQASCAYQDVTSDLFGVASLVAAAAPASDMWTIDTPFPVKFLRVKVVYNTGGNTGDATIYFRGTY